MNANDLTQWANVFAAAAAGISSAIGGFWAVARFVLVVCDALDERWPGLKRVTNPLGRFLGGAKGWY